MFLCGYFKARGETGLLPPRPQGADGGSSEGGECDAGELEGFLLPIITWNVCVYEGF